jgi:hypothetical protein
VGHRFYGLELFSVCHRLEPRFSGAGLFSQCSLTIQRLPVLPREIIFEAKTFRSEVQFFKGDLGRGAIFFLQTT